MHLAARKRDVDMVRILVDYGTNVDVVNGEGQTALHIAAAEGDEAMVKYFYGVRASASIADFQGSLRKLHKNASKLQFLFQFQRPHANAFGS